MSQLINLKHRHKVETLDLCLRLPFIRHTDPVLTAEWNHFLKFLALKKKEKEKTQQV